MKTDRLTESLRGIEVTPSGLSRLFNQLGKEHSMQLKIYPSGAQEVGGRNKILTTVEVKTANKRGPKP